MEFYYHEIDHDVLILAADGGLDSENAGQFVHDLEALVDAGLTKIIVDCSALHYVSNIAAGRLVQLHGKLAARGGDVKLAEVKAGPLQYLSLVRLDRLFEIYPDVNRARLAFRAPNA